MAINIDFTSSGCSASATHYESASNTFPSYTGTFYLDKDLNLKVTFSDNGDGYFNYKVGYVAIGANGQNVNGSNTLSFGNQFGYGNSLTLTANLSGLTFPINFYFVCAGCDWQYHQNIGNPISPSEAVLDKWLSDRDDDP